MDYRVRPRDTLVVQFQQHPSWVKQYTVPPEGWITLVDSEAVLVDGLTPPQIGRAIAKALGTSADEVSIQVTGFHSQKIYLFGEVPGHEQALEYRGPETIVELLRRAGGLPPGSALNDIQVVRPHVADGRPPEIFRVDLTAILLRRDSQTNIRLEPSDQIHIGQSPRSRLTRLLPPWVQSLCNLENSGFKEEYANLRSILQKSQK